MLCDANTDSHLAQQQQPCPTVLSLLPEACLPLALRVAAPPGSPLASSHSTVPLWGNLDPTNSILVFGFILLLKGFIFKILLVKSSVSVK